MNDSSARLGACAEFGRGLRREAASGQLGVVGRNCHSFTNNMRRREIQGVGSVDSGLEIAHASHLGDVPKAGE